MADWVELWKNADGCAVAVHEVVDVGSDDFADVTEFPSLDPEEHHGEGKTRDFDSLGAAIEWIETALGGSRTRFVSRGVNQDEVVDARSRA